MRLYSTPESSRAGEPTVLAILETFAAMALSVWIGVHYSTWLHVAVGTCIAPLLLLRTDESCARAIHWFVSWSVSAWSRFESDTRTWGVWLNGIIAFTSPIWFPALAIASRVIAIGVEIARNGIRVGMNIPGNWNRQIIATDFATSPEWLPTPAHIDTGDYILLNNEHELNVYGMASGFYKTITEYNKTDSITYILSTSIITALGVFLTVSAIAYRWSLKSTALVWFPLLWAMQGVKRANQSWQTFLEIERTLGKPALVAVASAFTLLGLGLKATLWLAQHTWATRSEACREYFVQMGWEAGAGSLPDVITGIIRPGAIPLWQIATGINAILGLYLWWQIRTWLAHYQHGDPPQDESVAKTFAVTMFFRRLLTSYTIICNGYIAIQAARKLPIPEIGSQLFPFV